jgi:hypothetical protein
MTDAQFNGREITIEPPLNYGEIKKVERELFKVVQARKIGRTSRKIEDFEMRDHFSFYMKTEEFERETDEGLVNGLRCSELHTNGDYLFGYLSMADEINLIADIVPGHTFTGEVIAIADENRYAYKVVAEDVSAKGARAQDIKGTVTIEFEDGTRHCASDF